MSCKRLCVCVCVCVCVCKSVHITSHTHTLTCHSLTHWVIPPVPHDQPNHFPHYMCDVMMMYSSLAVEYGTVSMLTEVLHLTGVQALHHGDVVPISQLSSVLSEFFAAIRTARPVLKPGQLQQAQDCTFNWFQMAYRT